MPQSCKHPHGYDISHIKSSLYAASSKRNINVIAKPAAKTDMPSAPELLYAAANQRIIKIFWKLKAKNAAYPIAISL